ncbi:MAG TPA: CsgG/HfaB family protein [Chitinophagales bacterium]|nr:CsgG/HfaB family protein [Chitinophagales bacterium]HRG29539.1 CsgG/HfaB family protein [Chitinophagales bacterium]
MKYTFTYLIFQFIVLCSFAQNEIKSDKSNDKVTIENLNDTCDSALPLQNRLRFSVTSFNINTVSVPNTLGENMATMLTNGLQNTNCFRVLQSVNGMDDINAVNAFNNSNDSKSSFLKEQFIVTGEITEYSKQDKDKSIAGVKVGKDVVKLGFIIQILDPGTRDVLFSNSFNIEGKASTGGSFGVTVPYMGRINLAEATNNDPALADAMENGIMQAVSYIASNKHKIPLPDETAANINTSILTITGITFNQINEIDAWIKLDTQCVVTKKGSFENGVMTFTVTHRNSVYDLLTNLTANSQNKIQVLEVGNTGPVKLTILK